MALPHLLTVLGNACADTAYRLTALPQPGETVIAGSVTGDLGGKGLNQAVAAARAGVVPRFIAPVGQDAIADRIAATLQHEGIDPSGMIRRAGASDGSVILIDRFGENAIVSSTAQAEALAFADLAPGLQLTPAHLLLLQGNLSRATTHAAVTAARAAGATVALNAAPMRDWLGDLSPDILIANRGEAAILAHLSPTADPATLLAALSPAIAVITLGADGCLLRDHGKITRIAAPTVTVQDSAGAGDVFCGTFIAEWLHTGDASAAAGLAILAASAKVTRAGTLSAFPSAADIDRLRQTLPKAPRTPRTLRSP